jgi:uncharacterized damage-inducible protein DinB
MARSRSRTTPRDKAAPIDVATRLLRAYAASARVNEYLVERLDPAVWRAKPPAPKMRTIAAIVAHMHNCALVCLRRAAPEAAVPSDLDRFTASPAAAVRALRAKRRAMLAVLEPALEHGGRVCNWRWPPDAATFLVYYMVHDGHHRGQIVAQARLLGHPISIPTMSGMWQWPARGRE